MSEVQNQELINLTARVAELESIVSNLRQDIVTITADHIQRLFNEEVLIDSLSQRIMVAGANAIAFKAKQSRARAPEMVVIEGYIPGSVKARLDDLGKLELFEQDRESGEWLGGDSLSDGLKKDETQHVFLDLLLSYGAEAGKDYYLIDDITLEEFRKEAAQRAMQITAAADEEPAAE